MKLIRLSRGDSKPRFGVAIGDRAVAFASLQQRSGIAPPELRDSHACLADLPETERAARERAGGGNAHLAERPGSEWARPRHARRYGPPEVAAPLDAGSRPRQLKYPAEGLMKCEQDTPQAALLLQAFARALLPRAAAPPPGAPERLSSCRCKENSIVGDDETTPGPSQASRRDIGPGTAFGHDDVVDPGVWIDISVEQLGTVRCRVAEAPRKLLASRWPLRPALRKLHGRYAAPEGP